MAWKKADLDPQTEAFLAQEARVATEQVPGGFHMAFVRLSYGTLDEASDFVEFLADHMTADPAQTGLWLRGAELALLQERVEMIVQSGPQSGVISALLYLCDLDTNALRDAFPTVVVQGETPPQRPNGPARFGIIDDGIPYLNRRYRRQDGPTQTSRIAALWMQKPGAGALTGRVMERGEISAAFTPDLEEARHYRAVNKTLSAAAWHRRATEHRLTHGALVMDLAAGAEPADTSDPMREVDILAVQLATQSVKDSSGRRLREGILRGLRWIVRRALEEPTQTPLVVNISLGAMDGPRVSVAGYAKLIEQEVKNYKTLSGQDMVVTAAFGNARRNRQVATAKPEGLLANTAPAEITWRILPEDRSESLLQIRLIAPKDRLVGDRLKRLRIQIEMPGKPASQWMKLRHGLSRVSPDGSTRYWCAQTGQDTTTVTMIAALVVAPTAQPIEPDETGTPPHIASVAPAGGYIIRVRNNGAPVELAFQIQRDDTPPGFAAHGRQSYFDHKDAYGWDLETMDWTDPSASAITRQGSYSDLCAETATTIKTVGAAFQPFGAPTATPSRYSSEGTDLRVIGPTPGPEYSVIVDRSRFAPGLRASGVLSGSSGRLSGTSAAAPILARQLLLDPDSVGQPNPHSGRIGTLVPTTPLRDIG